MAKVVVRMHFLDDSVRAFAIDSNDSVETLRQTVVSKLELKEDSCFALFERREGWDRCLEGEEKPAEIIKSWGPEAEKKGECKFVFKKKTFMRDDEREMNDEVARHLLYIQALYSVIESDYPCTPEEAVRLAGIQMQVVYGDRNTNTQTSGFLLNNLPKFIPRNLFPTRRPGEWEQLIFKEHAVHKGNSKDQAEQAYLSIVKKWPFYGTTFYPACKSQNNKRVPNKVIIGVNAEGIMLVKPKDKELISTHPFTEICSWSSSNTTFAFEFGSQEESCKYTFETKHGAIIASTIQTYIDILVQMLTTGSEEEEESTATETSHDSDQESG